MTKMFIDRATVEQALEALEFENSWHDIFKIRPYTSTIDAVADLRTALAQQAEPAQEPVGEVLHNWSTEKECIDGICAYLNDLGKNLPVGTKLYTAPPKAEPVAWMYKGESWFDGTRYHDQYEVTTDERLARFKDENARPLYFAP